MEWNKGYMAACYGRIVDRVTWRDTETFQLKAGQISRSDSTLIEAADLTTGEKMDGEKWIRVYMDTRQNGAAAHAALFTGLAVGLQKNVRQNVDEHRLECYSVLKPAEDVLLPRGYFVPAGANGADVLKKLLEVTPAPVEVVGDVPRLMGNIIAEQGETNLSMSIKVLKAVDRRFRILGDGTIQICEKAQEAAAIFNAIDNDCVEPELAMTQDWFGCPNVFRAIADSMVAIARDDDEGSALSTVSRGREIWMEETGCNLNEGEGIAAYAQRRLKEEQSRAYEVTYSRRFNPDITISDIVGLHYPQQGLNGDYKVISQRITLEAGGRTEEQVEYC